MKKTYIQPQMKYVMAEEEALLASQSTLDPNQDNQGVSQPMRLFHSASASFPVVIPTEVEESLFTVVPSFFNSEL